MPVIRACFKVLTYNIISIYIYINIKGTDQKKSTIQISVRFFGSVWIELILLKLKTEN